MSATWSSCNAGDAAGASGRADTAVGIDLGTTYSCVGIHQNGKVVIIPNECGNRITSSCVQFTANGIVVGDDAKDQAAKDPENTVFEVKRLMGRDFWDDVVTQDRKLWPFTVIDGQPKPLIHVKYMGKEQDFSAEQISGFILSKMKSVAEKYLKHEVTKAVITVPAYFTDVQRQATKQAARLANLTVMQIINEPTAAAIAYAMDYADEGRQRTILVFDLGGGTFDVTILQIKDRDFVVKASSGNTHLGGADFDNRLVQHFAQEIKQRFKYDIIPNLRAMRRLRTACEKTKIKLSSSESATIEIDSLFDGRDFSSEISRSQFEEMCDDLFEEIMGPIEVVLQDAELRVNDIDDLVMVGGSSRVPKVQQLIRNKFEGKELARDINPDEAVAFGAVISAAMHSATAANDLVQVNISDVTPLSLGIRTEGGLMSAIIGRNTPIPCEKSQTFTTTKNNQRCVDVRVLQGERPLAQDNAQIGELQLDGIPPQAKGKPRIKVTFRMDDSGMLSVTSRDLHTNVFQQLEIQNASKLSEDQIIGMIQQAEQFRAEDQAIKDRVALRNDLHKILTRGSQDQRLKKQMQVLIKWWDKNPNATAAEFQAKLDLVDKLKNLDAEACDQVHACGHLCCGVRGEAECLPCLFCDPRLSQKADDNCILCMDDLSSAPSIRMTCGHVFHSYCCKELLGKRWPGQRITFNFMKCPTCKVDMEHKSLEQLLVPLKEMKNQVMKKAGDRLRAEGEDKSPEIHRPGGKFFKNPTGFAMEKYAYYLCSKCSKPYFAGAGRCEAVAEVEDVDPNELLCISCSGVQLPVCQKHGPEFQAFKCRFCCSFAAFICFGNMRTCITCHSMIYQLKDRNVKLQCPVAPGGVQAAGDCPLKLKHGLTGEEVPLACSLCRETADAF